MGHREKNTIAQNAKKRGNVQQTGGLMSSLVITKVPMHYLNHYLIKKMFLAIPSLLNLLMESLMLEMLNLKILLWISSQVLAQLAMLLWHRTLQMVEHAAMC
mgnify:CR=1 FL=1